MPSVESKLLWNWCALLYLPFKKHQVKIIIIFIFSIEAWVQNVQAEYIDLIKLNPYFFSCAPRKDILHQMVLWQLAKRRQGTHKTKFRLERAYTKKKMYKQKGTGRARHSDKAAPQFIRTGGHAHPVRPRDFSFKLNATVRRLALRMAITTKFRQGKLRIVNTLPEECKTKQVQAQLDKLQANNALIIDGTNVNKVYERASSNLHTVDVLSAKGINVYDMLRRDTLVLTMGCLDYLNTHYAQYMTACK